MAITPADVRRIHQMKRKKRDYTEWYSMKKALLSYVGLPRFFPLRAHVQHGAGMIYRNDVPDPHVLETTYQNIFLCNEYQKEICEQYLPGKDIYVIGSVFPLYRQQQSIIRDENAEGTLFFPAHSSESIEAYDDVEKILNILEQLPDYLKPVKVSIYYTDLLRGLHEVYENNGYETFTSGHRNDVNFIDSFYQTLKSAKFAMGTTLGSQTYYAVEMGIPYFIVSDVPKHINRGNKYLPEGVLKIKDRVKHGYAKHDEARSLFIKNNFKHPVRITEEQRSFVRHSIGCHDKISREELQKIVLRTVFRASM